jgi:hypothetical protein
MTSVFDWRARERERLNAAVFKDEMDTIARRAGISDPAYAINTMRARMPIVPVQVGDQVLLLLAAVEHLADRVKALEEAR